MKALRGDIGRKFVLRGIAFWLFAHGALTLVSGGTVIFLQAPAALALPLFAAFVGILDSRKRRESLFLENLGLPAASQGIVWAGVCGTLEIAILAVIAGAAGP